MDYNSIESMMGPVDAVEGAGQGAGEEEGSLGVHFVAH